jgi:ABC-type sugar transport system ATPase subunit
VPVYQEPSLIPDLNVADNLTLGNTPVQTFRNWVEELGIESLKLTDMISDLPLATLRILDLARALAAQPDVLLLDEMTAALPTDLVDNVLENKQMQEWASSTSHTALPKFQTSATTPQFCVMVARWANYLLNPGLKIVRLN